MAKIINLPSKKSFIEPFKGKVPDDILNHMSDAHDRVTVLCNQFPAIEFRVSQGSEEKAAEFKEGLEKYILSLLKRILELEAQVCLARRKT